MTEIITKSPRETETFAEEFAKTLAGGEVIAFKGSMGMGKTCFTRGLARGLGFSGQVNSPTFALVNEYIGGRLSLYHFDMYRITDFDDLCSTGFFDYLDTNAVLAIEWSENIEGALPENAVKITILRGENDNQRIFEIEGTDK